MTGTSPDTPPTTAYPGAAAPDLRLVLLGLALVRIALGMLAVALAPALFEDHFVLLVLLRPTKDVLLAAGFLYPVVELLLGWILIRALDLTLDRGGIVWRGTFYGLSELRKNRI